MENPKEIAEKLIKHFLPYVDWNDLQKDCTNREWAIRNAKKCALITVNEILLNIEATIIYHKNSNALPLNKEYWEQVKIEIQNYND